MWSGFHELASVSANRVADGEHDVGVAGVGVRGLQSPEAGHAQQQRVIVGDQPLGHQRVRDREVQMGGEVEDRAQLGPADAAAEVQQRPVGFQ